MRPRLKRSAACTPRSDAGRADDARHYRRLMARIMKRQNLVSRHALCCIGKGKSNMDNNQTPARRRPRRPQFDSPATKGLDLSSLFGAAAQTLAANQSSLNQADTENQNHGDNMVQAFNMIYPGAGGSERHAFAAVEPCQPVPEPERQQRFGTCVFPGTGPGSAAIPGAAGRHPE